MCTDPHCIIFFYKEETTMHLPHDMQQSMYYSYVQSQKPAVTSHHWDQYSRWRHGTRFLGQQISYRALHVFPHMHKLKGFQLWTLTFQELSRWYWDQNLIYIPCGKWEVGKSVENLEWPYEWILRELARVLLTLVMTNTGRQVSQGEWWLAYTLAPETDWILSCNTNTAACTVTSVCFLIRF